MDTGQIIFRLRNLVQIDIDAVHAYGQAISGIDEAEIRRQLGEFRSDHERHIAELSAEIRGLGGEPPALTRDAVGFLIEGFTAITSSMGTTAALTAMLGNEELTNTAYENALTEDLPDSVRELVRRNLDDERRHFRYITAALRGR